MSAVPAEAPETDSKKKRVQQAAVLGGLVLCTGIIAVSIFRAPASNGLAPPPPATVTAPTNQAEPNDLSRQAAELLARMQPETAGNAPTSHPGGLPGPGGDLSERDYAQLVEALGNLGAPPTGNTEPTPVADPNQFAREEALRESRLAPLAGSIERAPAADGAEGGAGKGTTGPRLRAGTILEAALAQTLSSDYPGTPFIATLTRDVRLADGSLALPKGSTVIGTTAENDGPNAILQGRLTLNADRIVRPDGEEIPLQARALDASGIGAIPGPTKRHVVAQAGGVLAYALIGAANLNAASDEPISSRSELTADAVSGAGQQLTPLANQYLNVKPTVTPGAGTPIRIVLTDGLAVAPYREG